MKHFALALAAIAIHSTSFAATKTLLGRITKADGDILQMEYIVVDTNKPHAVVSTPSLKTRLGTKADISMETNTSKIKVSVLAIENK